MSAPSFSVKQTTPKPALNELQRKMAMMKLEAQMDTPLGEMMGG